MWAGNFFGIDKSCLTESQEEIKKNNKNKIKEVYQYQSKNLFGVWKNDGLYVFNDTSIKCDYLFDPDLIIKNPNTKWKIDYFIENIDKDGWTYMNKLQILNNSTSSNKDNWNVNLRRRKWCLNDNDILKNVHISDIVNRSNTMKNNNINQNKNNNIYQNKNNNININLIDSQTQIREHESNKDLEKINIKNSKIDEGIFQISNQIDKLLNLTTEIKEENIKNNHIINKLENSIDDNYEKVSYVNSIQKNILKKT
jgi:hypothetical protein